LLKSTEVIQIWEFDNLHMTQCAKTIVGFMANVGNVFYPTFTNVFFSTFLTFFLIFISTFITSVVCRCRWQKNSETVDPRCVTSEAWNHLYGQVTSFQPFLGDRPRPYYVYGSSRSVCPSVCASVCPAHSRVCMCGLLNRCFHLTQLTQRNERTSCKKRKLDQPIGTNQAALFPAEL